MRAVPPPTTSPSFIAVAIRGIALACSTPTSFCSRSPPK
jgi:hypothetical protein